MAARAGSASRLATRGMAGASFIFHLSVKRGRYADERIVSTPPGGEIMTDDMERLQKLNRDYIRSVQESDVARFDQILSEDFLNSNPDGSLVDRAGFLAQIAPPAAISNLAAHDVRIRLIGDVAIIHARTTYTKRDGQA